MNNRPNSPKTASSQQSVFSIGMGDQIVKSAGQPAKVKDDLPRPMPEGVLPSTEPVYDCIVYLIYCPTHENFATTNVNKCKCVWLPFVPLAEGETWIKASHDGIDTLIGRNDPEMEAEEAERQAPVYKMNYLHIMRLQLPSRKVVFRLSQFVYLESNPNFQCCRNTERVNWHSVLDIHQNRISKLWGPEVKILTAMVSSVQPQIVSEFSCHHALYYLNLRGSKEQELLIAAKLYEGHVYEIYSHYVEHCYPAHYMSIESLRVYFLKFGITYDQMTIYRLFNAFRLTEERRSFIDFHEMLIGLVALEPNCSNRLETRTRFIFKYYDYEKKDQLTANNVFNLLKDVYPTLPEQKINEEVRVCMAGKSVLTYDDFLVSFKSKLTNQLHNLCRAPFSLLKHISILLSSQDKERVRQNKACQGFLKAKRVTKGTCWACRAQQYEYGNQCVTIDTVGRCVEPTMIQVMPPPSSQYSINRSRYSLECVFSLASIPSIFMEMIRDFHAKKCNVNQMLGSMAVPQEWHIFHKYLRILCSELSAMLGSENKLLKINTPAIVIGDLHGNLNDLICLERLFWQSTPVVAENLVFLGNYSGKCGFGVECLIYLFALKLSSPNKVHLLRGTSELGAGTSKTLIEECTRKFGLEKGKLIFNIFLQIFAKLPIAVLIDENILCTHSGIPSSPRLEPLMKLPKDMPALRRDSPFAYEIITRYPKGATVKPTSSSSIGRKSTKSLSGRNVNKVLVGRKVGDTRFHLDFKSNSARKSTSGRHSKRPKSAKSLKKTSLAMKSTLLAQKSSKSLKSLKSLRTKSVKSNKSLRSLKSLKSKSGKSRLLPKPKSAQSTRSTKSGRSLKSLRSNKTTKSKSTSRTSKMQFVMPKTKKPKLKPMFLTSRKMKRKSVKFKAVSKSRKSAKFPSAKKSPSSSSSTRKRDTFDRHQFHDFMKANDLSFLIRSASACKLGFKIRFNQKCLTVFSCSNFESQNEASVALVDGSAFSIRFLRFTTISTAPPPVPSSTPNPSK